MKFYKVYTRFTVVHGYPFNCNATVYHDSRYVWADDSIAARCFAKQSILRDLDVPGSCVHFSSPSGGFSRAVLACDDT